MVSNYFCNVVFKLTLARFKGSIKDSRKERLLSEESLESAADIGSLENKGGVLERNLSPSLQK